MSDVEERSEISIAIARGDLISVKQIVNTATSIQEKHKIINYARIWGEHNNAYATSDDPSSSTNWFDITPLTLAAMRGHHDIVEYLLRQGADPTLKGISYEDIELPDNSAPLIELPHYNMNAFDAANKLTRKIRCCRRTEDLLRVVKPYWKRCVYSGASATRHQRLAFTNEPINSEWLLDALDQVPKLHDYPLKASNFDEDIVDTNNWTKKYEKADTPPPQSNEPSWVETGQSRRCYSCGELKPVQSYNKNEKRKGVEARCITCVATRSEHSTICASCKAPMLSLDGSGSICQSCHMRGMGGGMKREVGH